MSGNWYAPDGTPRPSNAPTEGADSYVGSDSQDFWLREGGEPSNQISGGDGDDVIHGNGGDDFLFGDAGDDQLNGGAGNDDLSGGFGDDVLHGGAGDDFLNGIPGNDTLYGGDEDDVGAPGQDVVVYAGRPEDYRWEWVESFGGWRVTDINDADDRDDGVDYVYGDIEWVNYGDTGETLRTPCYAAGTRILTDRGEVPVEALRAGDLVVTLGLSGPWLRPVRWIGHREVDTRRHPKPESVLPVRLRAGALGPGVPCRDLVVSPDHALYLEGALVPAERLLDGGAIRQEAPVGGRITYFHVELDRHDVIIADGAPAESWLDCGNRHQFTNGGMVVALHPGFGAGAAAVGCAPRLLAGPRLDHIRLMLADLREEAARGRRHG